MVIIFSLKLNQNAIILLHYSVILEKGVFVLDLQISCFDKQGGHEY